MTIRMFRSDDDKTADVHPDEVEHMKLHGWEIDGAKAKKPGAASVVADAGTPPAAPVAAQGNLTVAKGARGLFFVKDADGKNASKGYDSEAEALAEMNRIAAA